VNVDWPAPGTLLASRYRLVDLLETGGMAEVWHAHDQLLGRSVAIKMPTTDAFVWKEARAAARLSHPHVAAVHDYSEATRPDGEVAPFVVMELLSGESLAARLERSTLGWREAAGIGVAVADALAAAHASGVVHRDIKPGNVMLTPATVKILDFGISAATGESDDDETGLTFGTPAYVSPERLDGKPAEPATDIYGLGVLLFEMVTGDPPYPVDTWEELAAARKSGPGKLPADLPEPFRDLVARCLRDEPAERPAAAEVRDELTALAPLPHKNTPAGYAVGRVPPATLIMRRAATRRRPAAVRVGIATALLAVGGVVVAANAFNRTDEGGAPPVVAASPVVPATSAPSSAPPPSAPPSSAPATSSAPVVLDFNVAVSRVRTAVEAGRAGGQIRTDVATDLLNLIRSLSKAGPADVDSRVEELRRKIDQRVNEGSLAQARAVVLQSRLADLGRATRT
jgi:eukaryotic-like serine/threonine-protein kinase